MAPSRRRPVPGRAGRADVHPPDEGQPRGHRLLRHDRRAARRRPGGRVDRRAGKSNGAERGRGPRSWRGAGVGPTAGTSSTVTPDEIVVLSPLVRRVLANNPSIMTGPGTNTYLIGTDDLAVTDPGP